MAGKKRPFTTRLIEALLSFPSILLEELMIPVTHIIDKEREILDK